MAEWVDVAQVEDFPPGTVRTVEIEGTAIAVFNLNGHYYAIEDVCTHEAETLSGGEVAGEEIVCPRHGAHFSIRHRRGTLTARVRTGDDVPGAASRAAWSW